MARGTIEVPPELRKALAENKVAKVFFEKLPPSRQREYGGCVTEAKKPETRERRSLQTVAQLRKLNRQ